MLNRLTLVLRPASSYHAQIKKILEEERFDFQFGTHIQRNADGTDDNHEDVVLVTCVDFHDVGVVLEKLESRTGVYSYLIDSTKAIFKYDRHNRKLSPLGIVYEGSSVTYNSQFKLGDNQFSFWESING